MHFGQRWIFLFLLPEGWSISGWFVFIFFGKSTNSAHGKRASFSQNSHKWRPFSENVCFSLKFSEFFRKSANSTHGQRYVIFAEFAKTTPLFWKCVFFSQNSQKWAFFRRNEQGAPAKIGVGHFILDNLTHAYHGRITCPWMGCPSLLSP